MAAIVRRADMRVRHGFQLAQRGALYSARSEYIAALQMIAQANDAEQSNQYFSTALAAGLVALKESSDFVRQNPRKPLTDVKAIVGRHRTSILKDGPGMALSPRAAAQRYYTYAQEQLAIAAAGETTGAMALFGLGKVAIDPAGNRGSQALERTAQAMAFYQASLLADPQNYRAANELGVLVAENGGLERARELFVKSVSLSPQPAAWRNLAVVHSRLGEKQLADAAVGQAAALEQAGVSNIPAVKWVDPATFSRTVPVTDSMVPTVAAPKSPATSATAKTEQKAPVSTARKGISDWLPWNPRR
jgi:tetratricopeptide (TPR) repeat protein